MFTAFPKQPNDTCPNGAFHGLNMLVRKHGSQTGDSASNADSDAVLPNCRCSLHAMAQYMRWSWVVGKGPVEEEPDDKIYKLYNNELRF